VKTPGLSDEALMSAASELCRRATVELAARRFRHVEILVRTSAAVLGRRAAPDARRPARRQRPERFATT
jgi:hypothetical protein